MTALIIIIIALVAFILYLLFYPRKKKIFSHQPYLEALAALLDNNDDLAVKKLKEAVNIDTNLVDGYIKLGNLYRKKGDRQRAIQVHQSLTVRPTLKKDEEKKVYYALVDDYVADKRPNKAISFLKEILKIDKNDRQARTTLLNIYEDTGNYADCIAAYEEGGPEFRDERRRAFYYAAMANSRAKEPASDEPPDEKDIVNLYRKALKILPDSIAGLYYMAEYMKTAGDLKKVKDNCLKLVHRYPDFTFLVQHNLEKVLYDLGSFDEIVTLYERIFSQNPRNFTVGFALADLNEKKNEIESAKDIYRKLGDIYPRSLKPKLRLLKLTAEDKQLKRELNDIDKSITDAKYVCSVCHFESNRFAFICPRCHALESLYPAL
jgi:lipopolysaccharide biosynthesis regulator YciM